MRRREFIKLIGNGVAVWPVAARARQSERTWRIGYLSPISVSAEPAAYRDEFRAGLRDFGYFEGKNLQIESRYAEGDQDRLTRFATELVSLKVDVIVSYGLGAEAARHATALLPVVMVVLFSDPLNHLVFRLSRPGGNFTGSAILLPQLMLKRLELLKQALPSMKKVGVLFLKDYPGNAAVLVPTEIAAKAMGVEIRPIEAGDYTEYGNAFSGWADTQVDAVLIEDQPEFLADAAALATLAERHRLASVGSLELAASGGLMAYGVSISAMFRRGAAFVDKILKGENPGNIPIEQPTKFKTVLNLKTAKVLGLTLPPLLLTRADEVIE